MEALKPSTRALGSQSSTVSTCSLRPAGPHFCLHPLPLNRPGPAAALEVSVCKDPQKQIAGVLCLWTPPSVPLSLLTLLVSNPAGVGRMLLRTRENTQSNSDVQNTGVPTVEGTV